MNKAELEAKKKAQVEQLNRPWTTAKEEVPSLHRGSQPRRREGGSRTRGMTTRYPRFVSACFHHAA